MNILNIVLHLDKYLNMGIQIFGLGTYFLLFLILFCETGLVITPFLPGDSLISTAGALSALGSLNIVVLFFIFASAAIAGDSANYFFGKSIGLKIVNKENVKFIKREYLEKTQDFYDKYGGITILLARFIPIVRTFAPFVAGIGKMKYLKFFSYNVIGAVLWTGLFLFGGYFFGNLLVVKNNFSLVIFAIIFISILPAAIGFVKQRFAHE
jgi:membrane-associated protein